MPGIRWKFPAIAGMRIVLWQHLAHRFKRREIPWKGDKIEMRALLVIFVFVLLPACRTNESPEGQVNDLKIATEVKSKLVSDVGLSSVTNISVNSTNRVVTLSGQVDSSEIQAKAEAAAKSVPDAARVVDTLQVVPKH
jgi:BON domain